jgi:hypothetical protein
VTGGRPGARADTRGVARNQRRLSLRLAAINLRRLVNLGLTHNSHRNRVGARRATV